WREMQGESFWTIGDSSAMGRVLAVARPRLGANERWMRFVTSPLFAAVPAAVVVFYLAGKRWTLPSLALLQTLVIVGIAACIDWALRFPAGPVGRVLNSRPFVFVGTLSYSLYLWQQPFFNHRLPDLWFTSFPLNITFPVAAALASYFVVEKRFLSLRERIESRIMSKRIPLRPAESIGRVAR